MSETKTTAPELSSFELIDASELGRRLHVPTSWIRNHTAPRTPAGSKIPHVRFGRYVRFAWNSPALTEWLRRQQCR
jgi:hypothetical protein